MDKYILPFTTDVEILAYQNKAFPLGIIKANVSEYDIWLCNKFVNCILKINGEFNSYDKDLWSFKDGLTTEQKIEVHPDAYAYRGLDLLLFNKEMINNGSYIIGQYNEFFIKGKKSYKKHNFDHDYIIFGYDDKEGVFKSAGYLKDGHYTLFNIEYEAYYNSIIQNVRDPLGIYYYQVNKEYLPEIKIEVIKEELENYLYSRVDGQGTKTRAYFGMRVWDKLIEYVMTIGEKKLDYKFSRHCMEHRGIMYKRIKILYELGYLNDGWLVEEYYQHVYLKTQTVHYLFMKFNLSRGFNDYCKIINLMKSINEKEYKLISVLIQKLIIK